VQVTTETISVRALWTDEVWVIVAGQVAEIASGSPVRPSRAQHRRFPRWSMAGSGGDRSWGLLNEYELAA
jgi:hypothetical protein